MKLEMEKLLEEDFSNQPGFTEEVTHTIRTGDSPPIYQHPYRIPVAWQAEIREEVKSMLDAVIDFIRKMKITPSLGPSKK